VHCAFSPRHHSHVGRWLHAVESSGFVRLFTRPLSAWLLETVALWVWHIPALYDATLSSDWIHAAQHLSFFLTAVLFWSALYGVGRSAMSYGAGTFYVFAAAAQCSALGALLTFSSVLWYLAYASTTALGNDSHAGSAARRCDHVDAVQSRVHHRRVKRSSRDGCRNRSAV
jgi:putative membrane protein